MIKLPKVDIKDLKMPQLKFNVSNRHVASVMKDVTFLDIETSINPVWAFRTGKQYVTIDQMEETTKILTVAGGSMYDLYTKKKKGVWSVGNHHFKKAFKNDPLNDTELLRRVWKILDEAKVVVAHNGRFDEGWLRGRFLEKGWKQPSRFSLVCTYQGLRGYNMSSKKLDFLSKQLCGTAKIPTEIALWIECSRGNIKAFERMEKYNIGDVYDTLFKVYLRTSQYYPQYAVDMTDYSKQIAQCRVTGHLLKNMEELYTNHTTGLQYRLYNNPKNGLVYRDRYNINSKKSGLGYIRHHK